MLRAAVDGHRLAAAADAVHHHGIRVEQFTLLIEIRDLEFGSAAQASAGRFPFAQQQFDQRGFAGAVGADDADAVAAHDAYRKIIDDGGVTEAEIDVLGFEYQLTGLLALFQF